MSKALNQLNETIQHLKHVQESIQESLDEEKQRQETVFYQKTERVLYSFLQDRLTQEDYNRARHLISVLVQESS